MDCNIPAETDGIISRLETLLALARQESQRLEAAIRRAQSLGIEPSADALATIEGLADPAALEDPARMAEISSQIPPLPEGVAADLFDADMRAAAVACLADRGRAAAEIARELGLPLGEVELLMSLRST